MTPEKAIDVLEGTAIFVVEDLPKIPWDKKAEICKALEEMKVIKRDVKYFYDQQERKEKQYKSNNNQGEMIKQAIKETKNGN